MSVHTDLLISFKQLCNIPLYVALVGTFFFPYCHVARNVLLFLFWHAFPNS